MRIFIDAGHNYSGADTGATGNGLREQDITFYVSKLLSTYLRETGHTVMCSRNALTDNLTTTLTGSIVARYSRANDFKADLFISLHCDSSAVKSAKGAHICVYAKNGTPYNLAQKIVPYLLNIGLNGRNEKIVRRTDLGVLKHTNMPAILIEMGFITNPDNATLMRSPETLAKAIYEGICDFTGVRKPVSKEYMSVTDAIALMSDKGIISDAEKWYNGTWNDNDFKWLLRKVGTYIADKM